MREVPECLNRRYLAIDDLIRDIKQAMGSPGSVLEDITESDNVGIKLMCDFWEILKENPDCNLTQEVQQRMGMNTQRSGLFAPKNVACYMAGSDSDKKCGKGLNNKNCCPSPSQQSASKSRDQKTPCCAKSSKASVTSDSMPLSKVLCNLNEAASFEKKCRDRITELMDTQKSLKDQIQTLESREKDGVQLLKQADCMWSCMEESYKKKVAESLERQKILMHQMKEVETSANKWRKNKKDLEFQLENVKKCHQEIKEKTNQKTNDQKVLDMEIEGYKKRIEAAKKDTEASRNSHSSKKSASDAKIAKMMTEITRLRKQVGEEDKYKHGKENEGAKCVKEAREELQKICKVLLKKKLENEDLVAEKQALLEELELLQQTRENCKDKCRNKQSSIMQEIKKIDKEIANYKAKCIKCHQCVETADARNLCTDCPRCLEKRECLIEGDHCVADTSMDCVCNAVKQRFMDNVFDNMYTVLAKHAKNPPGKAVSDAIVNCLKRSRNGKLNEQTRQILQEFILTTVKRNLNLTIVGGAVKTRCELDSDTYKQLLLCLKKVKPTPPVKVDKAVPTKRDPCGRWGGQSECNCPKGPKFCVCNTKAPPPPKDSTPCPPPVKEDVVPPKTCPHKKSASCGVDCAMHSVPSAVGTDVAAWKPEPCKGSTCPFSKSMRAAQCALGSEPLASLPVMGRHAIPFGPNLDDVISCDCGSVAMKPCPCSDGRRQPRQRIIDEVMGSYKDMSPIQKVASEDMHNFPWNRRDKDKRGMDLDGSDMVSLHYKILVDTESSIGTHSKSSKESSNDGLKESINAGIKVTPLTENNINKIKKSGTDVNIILCPKFIPLFNKNIMTANIRPKTKKSKTKTKRNVIKQYIKCSFDSCDGNWIGKKVCNTVKELMKDIVISDKVNKEKAKTADNIEWITAESLCKEIAHLSQSECPSNITQTEVEMTSEVLEETKHHKSYPNASSSKSPQDKTLVNSINEYGKENNAGFKVLQDNITVKINCSGINIIEKISKPFNFMEIIKLYNMGKGSSFDNT